MSKRIVVCAANRYRDIIVLGVRHFDQLMHNMIAKIPAHYLPERPSYWEQGFVDQYGVFMNRVEALEVANKSGQINTRREKTAPHHLLFSEDIY
jgi:hypothetical protein